MFTRACPLFPAFTCTRATPLDGTRDGRGLGGYDTSHDTRIEAARSPPLRELSSNEGSGAPSARTQVPTPEIFYTNSPCRVRHRASSPIAKTRPRGIHTRSGCPSYNVRDI